MGSLAAVVLCAGKGTRMKSERAKVLQPVLGRPLFVYPVERALELGANPVVVVVGHQAETVREAFAAQLPDVALAFATQTDQRGTGHAVQCALPLLEGHDGPVLLLYGDVPLLRRATLEALLAEYDTAKGPLALVTSLVEEPSGYGRIVRKNKNVVGVVEQRDCTKAQLKIREINAGIYVVDKAFLVQALGRVGTANAQGEVYLTDVVALAAKKGSLGVLTVDFAEAAGVNDRAELVAATQVMQRRVNAWHLDHGVTLDDPATTRISDDVEMGPDTHVGPGVTLTACRIGRAVEIGQGALVTRATVGDGARVLPYSIVEESIVGPGCTVGPYARLRPGSVLAENVHIGNFVETKKTHVGKGSKANHLSYLGDAQIGEGVNVGAGTITCNYDGQNKHPTRIGDGAFIGSDTQLVAPVSVGERAYVGAGSTITEDVPPDSLALSRASQVIKHGWVKKRG